MGSHHLSNPGVGFGGPRYPGTFLLALREAFSRLGWQAVRWLGDAVECTDAGGREQVLALENLYRRVRPIERASWAENLAEFLARIPDEALVDPPAALADVADRVLIRLGPPVATHDAATDLWSHRLAGTLIVATLVVDYPSSMSYVTTQMVADSGQSGGYWMQRAIQNLREHSPAGCMKEVHAESGLLQSEVSDAYDASRALILDHLLPGHEEHGFFVAVPGRDHLLALPVSGSALAFLPWLRSLAMRTHRNLPYPISPQVFWIRRGGWHHFAIEVQGDKAMVSPPREFVEVLQQIAPNLPEEPPDYPGDTDVSN